MIVITLFIATIIGSFIYAAIYYIVMPTDSQEKLLYFHAQSISEQ
jgi:hypothetical protein